MTRGNAENHRPSRILVLGLCAFVLVAVSGDCSSDIASALSGSTVKALQSWTADAKLSFKNRKCAKSPALAGITLARSNRLDEGVAFLQLAVKERPDDWVSRSYLGAAFELMARKQVVHAGANASAQLLVQEAGRTIAPGSNGYTPALQSAIVHFRRALVDRAAWLRAQSKGTDPNEDLPQTAFAQPPSLLFRSLGTCLLWAGQEPEVRTVCT
jgi:hypothetical protein